MNFFPHHISTPSKPSNFDFPKIVDFTNKENSWKRCSNSEMIEKTWLLQESITQPTTSFEVFVNKKPTFNCSINDAGTTIFLRCWAENKISAKIVLTVFEQKFAFESFGLHFWEKIDWQQTLLIKMIGRDVGRKTKQQMLYPLSSSKSMLWMASGLISEKIIHWHQTLMI